MPSTRPPMPGELMPARPRSRVVASSIDLVVAGMLGLVALVVLGPGAPGELRAAAVIVASSLPTYLVEVVVGRSLGKAMLQLRHVRPQDPDADDTPALGTFLVRWGVKWFVPALFVALATPWTWAVIAWVVDGAPALVGDRRALHDRVAGTRVWELVATER